MTVSVPAPVPSPPTQQQTILAMMIKNLPAEEVHTVMGYMRHAVKDTYFEKWLASGGFQWPTNAPAKVEVRCPPACLPADAVPIRHLPVFFFSQLVLRKAAVSCCWFGLFCCCCRWWWRWHTRVAVCGCGRSWKSKTLSAMPPTDECYLFPSF